MKTKRMTRVLVMVLVLAMVLSVSALAAWPVYGGNNNHNAVVTNAPTSETPDIIEIDLLNAGSGWDGVDTVPVMQTVGTTTYAYVLYDGHSSGCTLAKINCSADDPYVVWNKQLETASGFQLSSPLLVQGTNADSEADDVIYAASNSGSVYKITGLQANDSNATGVTATAIFTGAKGQINTPIVKYGDYIYFGSWVGNGTIEGSTEPGRYYQVKVDNVTNNNYEVQSVSSISKGFYWAGAVMADGYILFGGDGGYLYWRPAGNNFGTETDIEITESSLSLADDEDGASDVGNIRSSIMFDGSSLYFTSQGGYLWCCTFNADYEEMTIEWKASLGAKSTSTPTKVGDRIYVGYYSGFSAGGVQCVSASGSHTVTTLASGFPVQSSTVVKGNGAGTDYVYFNTNSSTGCGYCYSYAGGASGTFVWKTDNDTYALGGMACDSGILTFGNDYNHLYIVK